MSNFQTPPSLDSAPWSDYYVSPNRVVGDTAHYRTAYNDVTVGPDFVHKVPLYSPSRSVRETYGGESLRREMIAARLVESSFDPTIELPYDTPRLLERDSSLTWARFSRVGGEVLSHSQIERQFTERDYLSFGQRLGEFVAWTEAVIDLDAYEEWIGDRPGDPYLSDAGIAAMVDSVPRIAGGLDGPGWRQLEDAGKRTRRDFESLRSKKGYLEKTGVGHGDLRTDNITFENTNGKGWRLRGVFDFGEIRRSSPAEELCNIVLLPRAAAEFAIEVYEDESGRTVPVETLYFHFRLRSMINAVAATLNRKEQPDDAMRTSLRAAFPNYDWSVDFPYPTF